MLKPKTLEKMNKLVHTRIRKNARKKVIPYMKKLIRVDSGALKKTLRVETEVVGTKYTTHIIAGDDQVTYAQELEIREGLFKDDTSLGQRFDELARLLND